MSDTELLTAERFISQRVDMPDGGRWTELAAGRLVHLEPPDAEHGTVVLNLSKAMADYLQRTDLPLVGYACFELGLLVTTEPDTIRCPAVSYFTRGERFAESGKDFTDERPALVIEIASTNERRRGMADRIREYHEWGIESVWLADPIDKMFHIARRGQPAQRFAEHHTIEDSPILPGFQITVSKLFAVPHWWRS